MNSVNTSDIEAKIIQLLKQLCPNVEKLSRYDTSCVTSLVDHYRKMGEQDPSKLWRWTNYTETVQVSVMNNIVDHIEKDIIEDKLIYLWKKDANKSEFEKGVYAAIRLIQHRVHCILDD